MSIRPKAAIAARTTPADEPSSRKSNLPNVTSVAEGSPALLRNAVQGFLGVISGKEDAGAFCAQLLGDLRANAARSARDQRHSVVQQHHGLPKCNVKGDPSARLACRPVPVEDVVPGPENDAGARHMFKRFVDVAHGVGRRTDIRMKDDRHDPN